MSPAKAVLLCVKLMLCIAVAHAEQELVLVASATSPLQDLDSLELRKLYCGFTIKREGNTVKGLRNTQDEAINRIFLQTVVAMSERSYMRRLLSLTVREGIPRPPEYSELETLADALSRDPYSVSYMWRHEAAQTPKVRILRVLWQQ